MRSSDRGCGHAVRPKIVRGVDEDEEAEWKKLAGKLKEGAAKRKEREDEVPQKSEEEEINIGEEMAGDEAEHVKKEGQEGARPEVADGGGGQGALLERAHAVQKLVPPLRSRERARKRPRQEG